MKKDKNKGIQKAGKKETSIVRSSAAEVIFDGSSFIDVFAGKNGVGKSNLFESFIEIFRKRIKRADFDEARYFIDIGPEYKELLIPHDKKKIKFFDIKGNQASCYGLPKSIAIKMPSADLIKYSEQEPYVGGSKIVFKSDGEKTVFAKEIAPTPAPAYFEVFRPMFEFIKSKCPACAESEDVAP